MPADQQLKDALNVIVEDLDAGKASAVGSERWYDSVAVHPYNWEDLGYAEYYYRRDTILVRTEDVKRVIRALREDPRSLPDRDGDKFPDNCDPAGPGPIIPGHVAIDQLPVTDGVTGLVWRYGRTSRSVDDGGRGTYGGDDFDDVGGEPGGRPHDDDPLSTPRVLERLDLRVGVGVGTPCHALWLCTTAGNGHPCPATEPAEVPAMAGPVPPVNSGICCGTRGWDGDGVVVGVVDGGLVADAQQWPWMAGVQGDLDLSVSPTKVIEPYAGHGTFVAGCVRCMAPKTELWVKKPKAVDIHKHGGTAYEHEIIRSMIDLLNLGADIIVCEFDGVTRLHLPMHTFDAFYNRRLRHLNVVVVAPAGNDKTNLRTFPAAYDWVIGVGALSANGNTRAVFSNYGHWVDVFAPGEDLVNAFPTGDYTCYEDPRDPNDPHERRHFKGLASWSGTSFSAPLVAGMIAARMSATGENAPRAAKAVRKFARSQAAPGIGPVLYPHQICGKCR
ncbi:S8/S53 family peptidase [Kribbella sp. NBC_00382]|uniref:S8 family peptidase n=1 Tax=Kribbella sp. NBC_00382 TaxID=2975967 RepID=UPI002E217F4D